MLIVNNYSYFLHTIPLFVYTFYLIFRDADHPLVDKFLKTGLTFLGIGIIYLGINCVLGTPFQAIFPFTWSYSGPITWGILFFCCLYVLRGNEENSLSSCTIAMLAAVGCGWLYEVPFFHPVSMFLGKNSFFYMNIQTICLVLLFVEMKIKRHEPSPILLGTLFSSSILSWAYAPYPNGQIICLLLLAYELGKRNFKPNRIIYAALILFMTFSAILFLNELYIHQLTRAIFRILNVKWMYVHAQALKWIYRIPASLFILSLLSGIKKGGWK